jgi:hypothetical protein
MGELITELEARHAELLASVEERRRQAAAAEEEAKGLARAIREQRRARDKLVKQREPREPRAPREDPVTDRLVALVEEHGPIPLHRLLPLANLSSAQARPPLSRLVSEGRLTRPEHGVYDRVREDG